MKQNKRIALSKNLKKHCHFSFDTEEDFIEVTQWSNWEGVDVLVSSKLGQERIALTFGQFDLLKELIEKLETTEWT